MLGAITKDYPIIIAALSIILLESATTAQPAIGIWGGLNRSDLSGDGPPKTSYKTHTGYGAGLVAEFNLAKDVRLSLQPMFIQKGTKIAFDVPDQRKPHDSLEVQLDYVSLPILLKVVSGNHKTYVAGGFDLGFLLSGKVSNLNQAEEAQDIKEILRPIDVAANFAFGIMVPVGTPFLTIEARYQQSLLNIAQPEESSGGKSLPVRFRSTGIQFYVGLLVPLRKK